MAPHPKPKHRRMKPSGKSPAYLDLIRALPCVLTGRPAEAAHVRYGDPSRGKPETGMGQKPHDRWALPLCPELHRLHKGCQHDSNEREWWSQWGIDPIDACIRLWMNRETFEIMEEIVDHLRPVFPGAIARLTEVLSCRAK